MTPLTLKPHEVRRILEHGDAVIVRVVKCGGEFLDESLFQWNPRHGSPDFPGDSAWWSAANGYAFKCPFGLVGGKLWGRETWCAWDTAHDYGEADEVEGSPKYLFEFGLNRHNITYKADPKRAASKWRSASQMPQWASRLKLTLNSVAVKRVNEVTAKEIIGAGIQRDPEFMKPGKYKGDSDWLRRQLPKEYWDVIGHSNPFVWVASVGRVG